VVRLIARRLLFVVPILLFVSVGVQLLLDVAPGDAATTVAGEFATPEQIAETRVRLGLDRPFIVRYVDYLAGLVRLDAGESLVSSEPVFHRIGETLSVTLSLVLVAMIIGVMVGISGGVLAALRRGSWIDHMISWCAAVALAVPPFVFGLALVVPLALDRSWLPATGYSSLSDGTWEWLRHLLLPALALALKPAAELMRQMRGALVDTMEQDFIRASRAKGLSELAVVGRHGLRNSAAPVLTILGLQLGRMLGSAVVVEKVFAMPGFGALSFDSVLSHDAPVIQGVVLVGAVIVLLSNLAVDIVSSLLNPKLRTG